MYPRRIGLFTLSFRWQSEAIRYKVTDNGKEEIK